VKVSKEGINASTQTSIDFQLVSRQNSIISSTSVNNLISTGFCITAQSISTLLLSSHLLNNNAIAVIFSGITRCSKRNTSTSDQSGKLTGNQAAKTNGKEEGSQKIMSNNRKTTFVFGDLG